MKEDEKQFNLRRLAGTKLMVSSFPRFIPEGFRVLKPREFIRSADFKWDSMSAVFRKCGKFFDDVSMRAEEILCVIRRKNPRGRKSPNSGECQYDPFQLVRCSRNKGCSWGREHKI